MISVPGTYYKITAQQKKECAVTAVYQVSGITLCTILWARISVLPFSWMSKEEMVLWFHEAKPFTKTSEALICVNYPVSSGDVNCVAFGLLEREVGCVMPQVRCEDLQLLAARS